jgi:hypothetical protein
MSASGNHVGAAIFLKKIKSQTFIDVGEWQSNLHRLFSNSMLPWVTGRLRALGPLSLHRRFAATVTGAPSGGRKPFVILGIETSCDDTALALVSSDGRVLADVSISQVNLHKKTGGMVGPYLLTIFS